ncbi:MAG: LCP family protein [Firmicutes bacterium]|nr:LCP family protein [Bacillota bacterium]
MSKKQEAEQPKRKIGGLVLKVLLVLAVLVGVGVAAMYFTAEQALDDVVPDRQEDEYTEERMNVLVVGTDADEKGNGRADSIMVFNVDLQNDRVNVVSIPRDSRVEIPGRRNPDKINHSYAYGGIELTKETVSNLLGVPIDYYAVTNFSGFEDIVELLGGVYIDVPKKMHTHTWYGDIDLEPGYQLLDAQQALGFVRYRYDAGGDIARAERQQIFLKAVYNRIISMEDVSKLPQVMTALLDMVDTDLSYMQLAALVDNYKGVDLDTAFAMETLQGAPQTINGGSYWILDEAAVQDAVLRVFYAEPDDLPDADLTKKPGFKPVNLPEKPVDEPVDDEPVQELPEDKEITDGETTDENTGDNAEDNIEDNSGYVPTDKPVGGLVDDDMTGEADEPTADEDGNTDEDEAVVVPEVMPEVVPEEPLEPEVSDVPAKAEPTAAGNLTITAKSVNVRSGPGLDYAIIASVKDGDVVSKLGKENGWYRIQTGGVTGYVAEYLAK